jgi:hypothetical protein
VTEAKYSFTTKFNGDLLTVRGDTPQEFTLNLAGLLDAKPGVLLSDLQALTQTGAALAVGPSDPWATQGNQSVGAPPAWGQQAPVAPPQVQPDLPTGFNCVHGQRTYRTGNGKNGAWTAYFCPSNDKANQCKPMGQDGKLWK